MTRFLVKRILLMIASLFVVILITFLLMHSVPGGPFTRDRRLSPQVEAAMREKYHLDDPLYKQFFDYLLGLVRGDLGPSIVYEGRTVNEFIASGFPVSATLGAVTIVVILAAALPLGLIAARKNGRWQDFAVMFISTIGITVPSFVVATALLYYVSFTLGWTPTFGLDSPISFVLPVIALGGYSLSFIARLMRSSLLEVMSADYIRTARAKGQTEAKVLTKHALRNALIPVATILGPTIAGILTGSFVIERIFAIPGMGVYFVDSIGHRDYTTIMGITVFYATFLIAMVLIVDIFYMLIDPRISYD